MLTLVVGLSAAGCSSLYVDAPIKADSKIPTVKVDASWYAERPDRNSIDRLKRDRKEHIDETLRMRDQGRVGANLGAAVSDQNKGSGTVGSSRSPDKKGILRLGPATPISAAETAGDAEQKSKILIERET